MKTGALLSVLAAASAVVATPTKVLKDPPSKRQNLPTITASGNAFYDGDTRFYMRGIDYQPGGAAANKDPLADTKVCKRDIKRFKELGLNTIRVYAVDNTKDHDECMAELADAGIYLVMDVNNPAYSINRADPHPSYNTLYLKNVFATVDAFSKYTNTLAFFSGNEVINEEKDTDKSAPYLKAIVRDMKNYQKAHNLRRIPVGYSAADTPNIMEQAHYFNCGDEDVRSDFFALNDYSYCNSDFQVSGWDQKVKNYTGYGIPIFLSEWGCIQNRPRKFTEIESMMHPNMTSVYSGGLMYEYSLEDNDYGIVTLHGDNSDKVDEEDEYAIFKSAMSAYPAPTSGNGGAATTTNSVSCPTSHSGWQVNPSQVPSMPEEAEELMKSGASVVGNGLKGDGSQWATDSGTSEDDVTSEDDSSSDSSDASDGDDDDGAAMSVHVSMGALAISGFSVFFTVFGAALL